MAFVQIGCSGFNYAGWRGTFYPDELQQKRWFDYYCQVFPTVELNVTFYRLPLISTYDNWYRNTPANFVFSLKGSRFITHVRQFSDSAEPLKRFFAGAGRLKEKLEVVLWQLPPTFKINSGRLVQFSKLLKKYPVRNAFEFRHASWITEEIFDIFRDHGFALCMADWPEFLDDLPVTADFIYIRRHGAGGNYDTFYSRKALKKDAQRIRNYLKKGNNVFLYFNNDAFGYAPLNARQIQGMLYRSKDKLL